MRNLISTHSSTDVSEEYAESVAALLQPHFAERETTQVNEHGQTDFSVRLHSYEAPGSGETMWAVDYNDPVTRELEETSSPDEANARYEELVRDSAANLGIDGEGRQERFTVTDVDGVPGPLPDLPDVEPDQVENLLDQPGTPVLYLDLTADGVVVQTGQAGQVDPARVLLIRAEVLHELGLADDGDSRVTAAAASTACAYGSLISCAADQASRRTQGAADVLFPAPTL